LRSYRQVLAQALGRANALLQQVYGPAPSCGGKELTMSQSVTTVCHAAEKYGETSQKYENEKFSVTVLEVEALRSPLMMNIRPGMPLIHRPFSVITSTAQKARAHIQTIIRCLVHMRLGDDTLPRFGGSKL